MRLPPALYDAIQMHHGDHGDWHLVRLPIAWIASEKRAYWKEARLRFLKKYPDLVYVTDEGAGRQFLKFHREMLQHFKWMLENTEGHEFELTPWTGVPDWLKESPENPLGFSEPYLAAQQAQTEYLIENGTDDELGGFLESTKLDTSFGSDIHNRCHGAVAAYESAHGLDDSGAEMEDLAVAHYNEHFWNLHAWLDDIYARWQQKHGEPVDQAPLAPGGHHGHAVPTPTTAPLRREEHAHAPGVEAFAPAAAAPAVRR